MPATRTSFWSAKIDGNRARDTVARKRLADAGWRTLCIWECALKGPDRLRETNIADSVTNFLTGSLEALDIQGSLTATHEAAE